MASGFLDADRILAATFVRHVEIHDSLGSTNLRAVGLGKLPEVELPALVVARSQTAGRGRGDHTWWSAEGALTFSLLLDTAAFGIDARSWPQLSLAMGVAVCDGLSIELERAGSSPSPWKGAEVGGPAGGLGDGEKTDVQLGSKDAPARLSIKWPNDVMLQGRKVCGILIESPGGTAPARERLVIGIGINVNNSWHSAPGDAGASGIALCDITKNAHDLQDVLQNVLISIHQRIEQLSANDQELPAAWQRLSWLTDQDVAVVAATTRTEGVCLGIDAEGSLLVENAAGTHRVRSGSVHVL